MSTYQPTIFCFLHITKHYLTVDGPMVLGLKDGDNIDGEDDGDEDGDDDWGDRDVGDLDGVLVIWMELET